MSNTTRRTDAHSPLNLVTEDYDYCGSFDSDPTAGMIITFGQFGEKSVSYGPERAQADRMRALLRGSTESRHDGRCDHCGAHIRYIAVMRHRPTGQHIQVGETCLDNRFSVASADFQAMRKAAELDRKQMRIRKLIAAFVEANPDLAWMASLEASQRMAGIDMDSGTGEGRDGRRVNCFVLDVSHKLRRYGEISERQAAAVRASLVKDAEIQAAREARRAEWAAQDAERPHSECPTGRIEIAGTVQSVKYRESDYGGSYKLLVLDDRGFKVYGNSTEGFVTETTPGGNTIYINHESLKGRRVTFTATVTRSDKDPEFGFYSRPTRASAS